VTTFKKFRDKILPFSRVAGQAGAKRKMAESHS